MGNLITYDDNAETFEGDFPRDGRMILLSFPSEQYAKEWYKDPNYHALEGYRREGTKLQFFTMVKGIQPYK